MKEKADIMRQAIEKKLATMDVTVYNVDLFTGDEREGTYFIDVEIGGSPEKYKRWYGYMVETKIRKIFGI